MNKIFKFGLTTVGLIFAVILIAAITLPLFFDPNDYRDELIAQVETKTGRTFRIDGELKLSVFPWLGVEIGGLTLGNAKGFSDQPMLKTGLVQARVKLLPILYKKVELSTVILEDVAVYLERDKSDKTNWDDLQALANQDQNQNQDQDQNQENTDSSDPAFRSLAIGGIHLENAKLVWDDQSQDKHYAVEGMNLKTGKLELHEPVDLEIDFAFLAKAEDINGNLAVTTKVTYDLESKKYRLSPFTLHTDMQGQSIPGGTADIKLKAKAVNADLTTATASLQDISLKTMGSELNGNIKASNIFDPKPMLNGTIQINAPKMAGLLKSIGQDPSNVPLQSVNAVTSFTGNQDSLTFNKLSAQAILAGGNITQPVDVNLDTQATINMAKQLLQLNNLVIKSMDMDIQANITGTQVFDDPRIKGQLKVASFNLRQLLNTLNLEVSDASDTKVLTKVALATGFAAGSNSFNMQNIQLNLDDSLLKGNLEVSDFKGPAATFNLAIDKINMDRYSISIVNKLAKKKPVISATTPAVSTPAVKSEDPLKTLTAKGTLNIGKLTVASARLSDVLVELHANAAKISLSPVKARLYNGSFIGRVNVDVSGKQPALNLTTHIKDVQAGSLLDDLEIKANVDGALNSDISLQAKGKTALALQKSLTGKGKFSFTDGTLKGINFGRIIREVDATINGKTLPPDNQPLATDFSEMSGSITIDKGLIENQDLVLKSPLLRVKGKGTAHLVSEKIDYSVTAAIVRSSKGQGGKKLGELERIPIPIKITGTFTNPQYSPDIEEVAKILAQEKLDKHIDKAAEKLDKILPNELKGLLGGSKQQETAKSPEANQQSGEGDKKSSEEILKEKLQKFLKF